MVTGIAFITGKKKGKPFFTTPLIKETKIDYAETIEIVVKPNECHEWEKKNVVSLIKNGALNAARLCVFTSVGYIRKVR